MPPSPTPRLQRLFPFLTWFPMTLGSLRADLMAGLAVAMVLIPQSMAYAQLAGLPAVYGLYAAFLPVMVAALWGSSRQLATGPAAIVSLLTASALIPLAAPDSMEYITLAISLALLVGLLQLGMGLLRLGVLVSFISHPVIVGFTNAAAIIIVLSQVNQILGVPMISGGVFLQDIGTMLMQIPQAHLPTLAMGLGAMLAMWGLRRRFPRVPGVLVVVVMATVISWAVGFEKTQSITLQDIRSGQVQELVIQLDTQKTVLRTEDAQIRTLKKTLDELPPMEALNHRHQVDVLIYDSQRRADTISHLQRELHGLPLRQAGGEHPGFYLADQLPPGLEPEGPVWRITAVRDNVIHLNGGGHVVGQVAAGLPPLTLPQLSWDMVTALLSTAFVIALVGFTEAIAIAKAMATRTGQRIDPNQELIGQGLAKVVGSFSQAYPVSGSFSRSAINLASGARTGMSSIFTGLLVLLVILFFTPWLYHLPQAVLAGIIIMAVASLLNLRGLRQSWAAHWHDGMAALVTFVATLALAPSLDKGILIGAGLALVLYLYRTMHPRVYELARTPEGTLADARIHGKGEEERICIIRFDGSLYFANVPYFEDAILGLLARHPKARYVIIIASGINELDASGEEVVRNLIWRLRNRDISLVFAGLKPQVVEVMKRTGLYEQVGEGFMFPSTDAAIRALEGRLAEQGAGEPPETGREEKGYSSQGG
ncbi:SulP family inorganic anion transporter [Ectothiorhodospira sp. PHS-1]|uniref:SulP family inorganic anion transporter n=1 Tax=Ectothiorhodospira sp. PHS-1 TaxID=519989 RepID=UPI00058E529F|nr:SulP family inorganic anion transporter [Ectothiorhodospira sp. PHS-1]